MTAHKGTMKVSTYVTVMKSTNEIKATFDDTLHATRVTITKSANETMMAFDDTFCHGTTDMTSHEDTMKVSTYATVMKFTNGMKATLGDNEEVLTSLS